MKRARQIKCDLSFNQTFASFAFRLDEVRYLIWCDFIWDLFILYTLIDILTITFLISLTFISHLYYRILFSWKLINGFSCFSLTACFLEQDSNGLDPVLFSSKEPNRLLVFTKRETCCAQTEASNLLAEDDERITRHKHHISHTVIIWADLYSCDVLVAIDGEGPTVACSIAESW